MKGWQAVLQTAIRLAGNCGAKARPPVRKRISAAFFEAVYIRDGDIGRSEFTDVRGRLFARQIGH